MENIFIDSSFLVEFLRGNSNVIRFMDDNIEVLKTNIIVFLETFYVYRKISLKYFGKFDTSPLTDIFSTIELLPVDGIPIELILTISERYSLLPNDALITATCKYYNIKKIATFDNDFERVDFLEVVKI